jgi:hypothetical protein
MDEGEPSQLYRTLRREQGYNPSQAVPILVAYYKISEEDAWTIVKNYHARGAIINGRKYAK